MRLPKPKSNYGYTYEEIQEFMTPDEYEKFIQWMDGQTQALIDGKAISYTHDVKRFLEIVRHGAIDLWD